MWERIRARLDDSKFAEATFILVGTLFLLFVYGRFLWWLNDTLGTSALVAFVVFTAWLIWKFRDQLDRL